jgi:hypothetical protein
MEFSARLLDNSSKSDGGARADPLLAQNLASRFNRQTIAENADLPTRRRVDKVTLRIRLFSWGAKVSFVGSPLPSLPSIWLDCVCMTGNPVGNRITFWLPTIRE